MAGGGGAFLGKTRGGGSFAIATGCALTALGTARDWPVGVIRTGRAAAGRAMFWAAGASEG